VFLVLGREDWLLVYLFLVIEGNGARFGSSCRMAHLWCSGLLYAHEREMAGAILIF
jgi:hypothetical protein